LGQPWQITTEKIHYSAIFIKKKQCRSFQIGQYEIGAIDITPGPYNVIDAAGTPHPRRFAIGAPAGGRMISQYFADQ
jgi:hypothetical protein